MFSVLIILKQQNQFSDFSFFRIRICCFSVLNYYELNVVFGFGQLARQKYSNNNNNNEKHNDQRAHDNHDNPCCSLTLKLLFFKAYFDIYRILQSTYFTGD